MAKYEGYKPTGQPNAFEVQRNGSQFGTERSLYVMNHSPTGFSWGYLGSGPAQLGLALLLDIGLGNQRAVGLHNLFTQQVIAEWDINGEWAITTEEICKWVANNENGKRLDQGVKRAWD